MIELGVLDARVARANASLQRGGDDPLGEYRDVAGKKTYDELHAYAAGPIQEPHRAALLRGDARWSGVLPSSVERHFGARAVALERLAASLLADDAAARASAAAAAAALAAFA